MNNKFQENKTIITILNKESYVIFIIIKQLQHSFLIKQFTPMTKGNVRNTIVTNPQQKKRK